LHIATRNTVAFELDRTTFRERSAATLSTTGRNWMIPGNNAAAIKNDPTGFIASLHFWPKKRYSDLSVFSTGRG
jgi:hypothetical protein